MPITNTYEIPAAEVRKNDEVLFKHQGEWWTVIERKMLNTNVQLQLRLNGAGEDDAGKQVRWPLTRLVTLRRVEATPDEKRERFIEQLKHYVEEWLPADDALDQLKSKAAANLASEGPIRFLTWSAAGFAQAEHDLMFRLGVKAHINHENENREAVTPLTTLEIADIILKSLEQLKKEMLAWYRPQSTSAGSNLAESMWWDAAKELTSSFGALNIWHLVRTIRDEDTKEN